MSSRSVAPLRSTLPPDELWPSGSGSSGSGSFGGGGATTAAANTAVTATSVTPRLPSTSKTQDVPFDARNGSAGIVGGVNATASNVTATANAPATAELEADTFGPQGAEATRRVTHPAFNLSMGGAALALLSSNSSGNATHASSNSSAGAPHAHSNSSGGAGASPSSSIATSTPGAPLSPATSTLLTTTAQAPAAGSASFTCGADDGSGSESSGSGSSGEGESDADDRVAFDPFCCAGCSEGVYDVGCAGCAERSNFEVLMGTYKPETRQCCPFDLDPLMEELTVMYALAIYGACICTILPRALSPSSSFFFSFYSSLSPFVVATCQTPWLRRVLATVQQRCRIAAHGARCWRVQRSCICGTVAFRNSIEFWAWVHEL